MSKSVIILGMTMLITGSCSGQTNSKQTSNSNKMMQNDMPWYEQDKLDVEKFLENAEERVHVNMEPVTTFYFFRKHFPDGREIQILSTGSGFSKREVPPLPHFYKINTVFYKNGNMERKGKQICSGTDIGEWEYYDENDNKTAEINRDEKYPDFDYNKVLMFYKMKG